MMSRELQVVSLLLCALLCNSLPLQSQRGARQAQNVIGIVQENVFDAGPVDSCEIPNTQFCTNVNYPVPASVARMVNITEEHIRAIYGDGGPCGEALREIHCAQQFPRCSEEQTVTLDSSNCTEMLLACPASTQNSGLCSLTSGSVALGNCRPVTDYDYQFQHCPANADWQVTEWMVELIKHVDIQLSIRFGEESTSVLKQYPQCQDDYSRFVCQGVGRCTADGDRIEVTNTIEFCDNMLSCYPDWLAVILRETLPCELWPSRFAATVPTTIVNTTTVPSVNSETSSPSTSVSRPDSGTTTGPPIQITESEPSDVTTERTWPSPDMTTDDDDMDRTSIPITGSALRIRSFSLVFAVSTMLGLLSVLQCL